MQQSGNVLAMAPARVSETETLWKSVSTFAMVLGFQGWIRNRNLRRLLRRLLRRFERIIMIWLRGWLLLEYLQRSDVTILDDFRDSYCECSCDAYAIGGCERLVIASWEFLRSTRHRN